MEREELGRIAYESSRANAEYGLPWDHPKLGDATREHFRRIAEAVAAAARREGAGRAERLAEAARDALDTWFEGKVDAVTTDFRMRCLRMALEVYEAGVGAASSIPPDDLGGPA